LRSLDRILAEAWSTESGLTHVVAYSDAGAARRDTTGFLEDYAPTVTACLDAYEATSDITYFRNAEQIAKQMIQRFHDANNGGFFDTEQGKTSLGVLGTPRKAFQDSPTPAGNPMAAIALIRLHAYNGHAGYLEKARATLNLLGGMAGQFGIFAATYGIAAVLFANPHEQVVIVGEDEIAAELYRHAVASSRLGRAILKLSFNQVVVLNLPPVLAETIPNLPAVKEGKSCAVVCANGACLPPVFTLVELERLMT